MIEIDREQVVDRVAVLALEAAHAAAERQTADAGVSHDADRAREPVLLRGAVELLEKRSALDSRGPLCWIYLDRSHPRKVDHDAGVARGEAGNAMAAAPHGDDEIVLSREAHRGDDILDPRAARDKCGIAVGDGVPNGSARVVITVAGQDQLAAKVLLKLSERGRIDALSDRHAPLL